MTTSPRRLLLAFAASLLLHAAALGHGAWRDLLRPPPARVLQATLRLPPVEVPPAEPLLKNTLNEEREAPPAPPPETPAAQTPAAAPPAKAAARQVRAAQKKLAEHLYYPPEAIARGLEGEARLILTLAADGGIADVRLAASSGHRLLDDAAVKAAWAIGRLPGVTARELILPVIFRLQ
ncbi:energy transducer TonB [Azospira restricta]|uniref:Energy transducer TonB n=1 Tax=Azospira restricta TaxID=404405 RepID=A0A974SQI3_9RHOO|nr:energy transducer TonB [Azospira restricta]QRJ64673.1 energy transducer TonB [Azospira restricta]